MKEGSLWRADCRAKGGSPGFKVAILGAAGGIGQPLAMLMKMNPLVAVLHLYDVVNAPGVTADISHMDTGAVVITSFRSLFIPIRFFTCQNHLSFFLFPFNSTFQFIGFLSYLS